MDNGKLAMAVEMPKKSDSISERLEELRKKTFDTSIQLEKKVNSIIGSVPEEGLEDLKEPVSESWAESLERSIVFLERINDKINHSVKRLNEFI